MSWLWRYRVRLYLHNAVWVLPTLGILAALLVARLFRTLDAAFGLQSPLSTGTAQTVLITLAASMFTCVVFVSSSMLLALQLASAQLTPRVIATIFRNPVTKWAMALLVFTFTFLVSAVVHIDAAAGLLTVRLSAYFCIASLAVFFYLIDHLGRLLRPHEVLRSVALQGRRVIESVYPHALADAAPDRFDSERPDGARRAGVVIPSPADGVVLACDVPGIVALAEKGGYVIEMVPQVGDFVAAGAPLFRVFGSSAPPADMLLHAVAIGHERTMEQDPAFAFRVIVDIACKALSPAINDPTTAVVAIDQIHHLLSTVGLRRLNDERVRDSQGRTRFIYRTPNWEDYVHLAVTEIRQYGRDSIQISRRLRAMLESLINVLPQCRRALLKQELDVLERSAARCFLEPEDRALAAISDAQGVGGRVGEGLPIQEADDAVRDRGTTQLPPAPAH